MANIYPYLHFNGNCREAMTFYHECLGGELKITSVGESQMAASMPKETHANTMHSELKTPHFILMGSDMMEAGRGTHFTHGNRLTICLVAESKEEIQAAFSKLSAGGTVDHPLTEEFFGTFGDLTDKFGFSWMFQFAPIPQPA